MHNFRLPQDEGDHGAIPVAETKKNPRRYSGISLVAAGILGAGLVAAMNYWAYQTDKQTLARWSELTNTLPALIAEGHTAEARELYESSWKEINQTLRNQGKDPITFISQNDMHRLETHLSWTALVERAKSYQPAREY